jgi:hypothetical protein
MRRTDCLARLGWFAALIAWTGLAVFTIGAWLTGLIDPLAGLAGIGVCAALLAASIAILRRAGGPVRQRRVARQLWVSNVRGMPEAPDEATVTPAGAPAGALIGLLAGGIVFGLLAGIALARALPEISTLALAAPIVALAAIAAGVAWGIDPTRRGQWSGAASDERLLGAAAMAVALAVFAFTRYANVADFPIYFFTDEAINPVVASELIGRGWRSPNGELLPAYFLNGPNWSLSLTVYVHAVAVALFGQSVEVARLTSATFALFGALAVGLVLQLVFRLRYAWFGVLFLAIAPAWFLHSRTAFETVVMVSCYSGFLLFYLLYRYRAPYFLFPALVCGTATFYAYTNGQAAMLLTAVLLALSDLRYHIRHGRTVALGLVLAGLMALPYLRFRSVQPEAIASQLRVLDSYLLLPMSIPGKIERFAREYGYGLSPAYWFVPNGHDLDRHMMKGYGHLPIWMLPFFITGVVVCARNIRSAMHRTVLIALTAAPFGSALAQIAVTRALLFVVPAAILSAIGFEWLVNRIRLPRVRSAVAGLTAAGLIAGSLAMWRDAVTNGPTWFRDYSLYGMQWGARQLIGEALPAYLRANPERIVYVSPDWANGADVFLRFFRIDPTRVQMLNIDHFLRRRRPLDDRHTLVMLPTEMQRANASGKFGPIQVERVIAGPDGSDAFYFARVQYSDVADRAFAQDAEARRQLVTDTVALADQAVLISHSRLDMGVAQEMFDGDMLTLARGEGANPFVIELAFPEPRPVRGVSAAFGRMDFGVRALVFADGESEPRVYTADYLGLPGEPSITLEFPGAPEKVARVRLEFTQHNPPEDVHIHVRDVRFR